VDVSERDQRSSNDIRGEEENGASCGAGGSNGEIDLTPIACVQALGLGVYVDLGLFLFTFIFEVNSNRKSKKRLFGERKGKQFVMVSFIKNTT
jgi:hypothetical protein